MQMITTFDEAQYLRDFKMRLRDDCSVTGDPTSGPAYGQFEKNKALGMIIGVVASVVTMGAALPMLASTVLATQIAGGIMFAGGALSGIGAVTGNKKLMKIGGVMSLAGGIGAIASNAANAAGAGGAFASGSSSPAISNMAGTMMESVNSVGGAVGYGDIYSAKDMGAATSSTASSSNGTEAISSPIEGPSAVDVKPLDAPTTAPSGELAGPSATPSPVADAPTMTIDAGTTPPVTGAETPAIDPYNVTNQAPAEWTNKVAGAQDKGILGNSLDWAGKNKELVQMAGNTIMKGVEMGFGPDQQAELNARALAYGAQASFVNSQQELLDYQKNNMTKQVAMISADDPDLDNKLKTNAAKGIPVVFIPSIGQGGVKPSGSAWNAGTANVAQQPARQPNFSLQNNLNQSATA